MNTSWSHLLVRPIVPALIRLRVRPNHITALHLVIGIGALLCIAFGNDQARLWAGFIWIFSCLLDRLDGELARIGNMRSEFGHRFDYLVDMWLTALFFAALGLSVHGVHRPIAIACGSIAALIQLCNGMIAERFDRQSADAGKMLGSRWGFDADDALYILGPLGWLPESLRALVSVLAGVGTLAFFLLFVVRLRRLERRNC